ncbi:MAG TPA: hypothetical protein VIC26_15175 [Marinagarivorans sp.]
MVKQRNNIVGLSRQVVTSRSVQRIATGASMALLLAAQIVFIEPVLACAAGVNSELEQLYCAVVAKGEGAGLPSFDDFRRNPPATQQLLLKRPAERAGLAMPAHKTQRAKLPKSATPAPTPQSTKPQAREQAAVVSSDLKGCALGAQAIQCGNVQYRLLDNRANSTLSQGALGPNNRLVLPPVPSYRSNAELHQYLQRAYGIYLEQMAKIGLSGATLSYSKFYYIFDDSQQQQQDFVHRFALMYDFLKKDKSTMAVAQQHRGKTPPALTKCQALGDDFITCDSRGSNWVYARKPY